MAHEDLGLGKLITEPRGRDAVHVAVAPMIARERLRPGQHVGLDLMKRAQSAGPFVGIVDPFLTVDVEEGQQFWLLLYPGTISYVRHVWSHPAFAPKFPGRDES